MNRLLTPAEVAHLLQIKTNTLAEWRVKGKGPAFIKIDRSVRYKPEAVQAFIDASEATTATRANQAPQP